MNTKKTSNLIFFGTSNFSAEILEFLFESFNISLVVSNKDKPVGRKKLILPTPVKKKAIELGLEVFQPGKLSDPTVENLLTSKNPEIGFIVSYGEIVPKKLIDIFPKGIVNLHFSILPKYRGATPVQFAILNGEKVSGATLFLIDDGMDTGKVLSFFEEEILLKDTAESFILRLVSKIKPWIKETLKNYILGKISPKDQAGAPSFCNFDNSPQKTTLLKKEDGRIDWSKTSFFIEAMTRAFFPFPGAFTFLSGKRFQLINCDLLEKDNFNQEETFEIDFKENIIKPKEKFSKVLNELLAGHLKILPSVMTSDGRVLVFRRFRLEGKREFVL